MCMLEASCTKICLMSCQILHQTADLIFLKLCSDIDFKKFKSFSKQDLNLRRKKDCLGCTSSFSFQPNTDVQLGNQKLLESKRPSSGTHRCQNHLGKFVHHLGNLVGPLFGNHCCQTIMVDRCLEPNQEKLISRAILIMRKI